MAVSYAAVSPASMELTPMKVLFKPAGALTATDLGGTLANIQINTKFVKANIMADQFGKTVLDRRVSGIEITVTTELTEIQNKDIWKVVFPHASETLTTTKAIDIKSAVGDSDLAHAGVLTLHPLSKAVSDFTGDYTFPLACASAESTIEYGPDKQAVLKIVWNILPDTSVTPAQFYRYGDPAV